MERKISKTKIEKRIQQKKNPELVETLIILKKKNPEVAKELACPVKKQKVWNLDEINKIGKNVLVVGKVLGAGELDKKIKIVAWSVSESAKEKIKKIGEFIYLADELKKNPELKGLEILK